MTIDIIIPTYNRRELLCKLISSLQSDQASLQVATINIIVADDKSTDGTREAISQQFQDVLIVEGPGRNAEMAKRTAIESSKGDFIVCLDDDCIPRHGWIAVVLPLLERGEKIVQSKVIFYDFGQEDLQDEAPPNFRVGFRFDMMPVAQLNGGYRPQYIEFSHEFGCFIAREVLKHTPLDDPNLVGDKFGSSASFSLRARQLGYRVFFEPASVIDHWGSQTGGFKDRVQKVQTKKECTPYVINLVHNFFYFGRKYRPLRVPILIPYYLVGGLYLSLKQRKNCLHYFIQGIRNGLTAPIKPVVPYQRMGT